MTGRYTALAAIVLAGSIGSIGGGSPARAAAQPTSVPAASATWSGDAGAVPAAVREAVARERRAARQVGDGLESAGPAYRARFDAGGFTYLPGVADVVTEKGRWQYTLEAVHAGDRTVFTRDAQSPAHPTGAGTTRVEYVRTAQLTERYDLLDTGVEQSFILHDSPGPGDVVVRGRVAGPLTPMAANSEAAPVIYGADGRPLVTYGVVTVVDAAGRTVGATVTAERARLDIRVPGAWLETAVYPIVIDPLVASSTVGIGTSLSDERRPAIAHDTKRNRYLVVWDDEEVNGTPTPRDVEGRLVNADGTTSGSIFDIENQASTDEFAPDVAYNAANDTYLVVTEKAFSVSDHNIVGRILNADTLASVIAQNITFGLSGLESRPMVVANPLPGATNRWFVAWEDNRNAGGAYSTHIFGKLRSANGGSGSPSADFSVTNDPVDDLEDRNVRATLNPVSGNYLVVFSTRDSDDTDVRAVRINGATGALTNLGNLSSCGTCDNATEPDVAWNVWTGTALAVWVDNRTGSSAETNSIWGRRLTDSATVGGNFEIDDASSVPGFPNSEPRVAPEFGGGWNVLFARPPSPFSALDIAAQRVPADGSAPTMLSVVTASDDDQLPDVLFNPYYGWQQSAYQHRVTSTDIDVNGVRASAGTYPIQSGHGNFDGLGGTDRTVVRLNATGTLAWFVSQSSGGATGTTWGAVGDVPVAGDYDGDGKADVAVWRPSDGGWYRINSSTGVGVGQAFGAGAEGDMPVPADYDGDGKTDLAVYRPGTTGAFYLVRSSTGAGAAFSWGTWGDIPLPGDFDGDAKADIAVWRPSTGTFFIIRSSTGVGFATTWGTAGDQPLIGDFDGDGIDDIAVFRPTTPAVWFVIRSSTGTATATSWGELGDLPVAADYDNDGKTDIAVWRQGTPASTFFIIQSGSGAVGLSWGTAFDLPIAR